MTEELVTELLMTTFQTIALLAAPVIVGTVLVGVLVNVLQTVTQIRDPALAFVPKVIVAATAIVVGTPWYIQTMRRFFETIIELLGQGAM